jgi:hypothetical protein
VVSDCEGAGSKGTHNQLKKITDCDPLEPVILVGENHGGARVSLRMKVRPSNSEGDLLCKRFPEQLSGGFRQTLARIANSHGKVQMSFWD